MHQMHTFHTMRSVTHMEFVSLPHLQNGPLRSGQPVRQSPQLHGASGGFTGWNSQGFTVWTKTVCSVILEAEGKRKGETNVRDCQLLTPCRASHDGPAPRTDMDSRAAFSGLGLFRMRMGVQAFGTTHGQLIAGNEGELPTLARRRICGPCLR